MPYSSIIALIDEHLDRLRKARTLLTSELEPDAAVIALPARTARKASPASAAASGQAVPEPPMPEVPALEEAAPAEAAPVTVQRLPAARLPRGRRQAARKTGQAETLLSALGGTVPALPVYVSAQQVRDEKSIQPPLTAGTVMPDAPTAEMLARRWLTHSAS